MFQNYSISSANTKPEVIDIYALMMAETLDVNLLFRCYARVELETSIPMLLKYITEIVGKPPIKSVPVAYGLIVQYDQLVVNFPVNPKPTEIEKRAIGIGLVGEMDEAIRVHKALEATYPRPAATNIDWFFAGNDKPQKTTVDLSHHHQARNEFFPWIKPDIQTFQQQFLDSDANVLLLTGEPGCGKTSFIRNFIATHDLDAAVTYDETLMKMDSFYIEFITKDYDLLVIEDADIILKNREDGNKVMSKLLNASDGLIQTKKKIIFTANLTKLSEIDEALMRPGRCFETLVFREMTYHEAKRAAEAAGLPEPDGSRTLARLFSEGPKTNNKSQMGFTMP
jgi:hypothetical protein